MSLRNRLLCCTILSPLTALFLVAFSAPCKAQKLRVEPQLVEIGSFFGGTHLKVSGDVPQDSDVLIGVFGNDVEQELMRKGRRWELWMNVGEVDITGVPRLYLLACSDPELLKVDFATVPLSYEAVEKGAVFNGRVKEGERSRIFEEFVRLKESQGLYGIFPGAVKISSDVRSGNKAEAAFQLNSRISPGSYRVCLWAVRNGLILNKECVPFTVVTVGIPAFLSSLANGQPVIYGFLAIITGLALGLLPGIPFTRKAKRRKKMKTAILPEEESRREETAISRTPPSP